MIISKYRIATIDENISGTYQLKDILADTVFTRALVVGRELYIIGTSNTESPATKTCFIGFSDGKRPVPSYMRYFDSVVVSGNIWHAFEKLV